MWIIHYSYAGDSTPVSMNVNGTEYYYLKNAQGDITHIVDGDGNEVAAYEYDAWGNHLSITGGDIAQLNPYRYRGYRYDSETGLYYLQSRYYNPEWGRFINGDAFAFTGQGLISSNMFIYCLSNPIMFTDKNGYNAEALRNWTTTMWWLTLVDGPVPAGDLVYIAGIAVLGGICLYQSQQQKAHSDRIAIKRKLVRTTKQSPVGPNRPFNTEPPKLVPPLNEDLNNLDPKVIPTVVTLLVEGARQSILWVEGWIEENLNTVPSTPAPDINLFALIA